MTLGSIPDDLVLPFQLDKSSLRGRLVRLGPSLDTILRQHRYPALIGKLLGQTTALAIALSSALKFEGVFTLQTKSDGCVRFLVADVTSDGGIRAYAQFDPDGLKQGGAILGNGHLAFTVDRQAGEDRYQGIVPLQGDSLAEAVQYYFRQSEQIPTALVAEAELDADGHWRGGCLMVQRMPREGGTTAQTDTSVEDDWLRTMMLMRTCTSFELADPLLPPEDLLYRLFHEEDVRIFEAHSLRHQCRCSQQRVCDMLKGIPFEEVEKLAVNGVVSVTCEFCNHSYHFDEAARAKLKAEA